MRCCQITLLSLTLSFTFGVSTVCLKVHQFYYRMNLIRAKFSSNVSKIMKLSYRNRVDGSATGSGRIQTGIHPKTIIYAVLERGGMTFEGSNIKYVEHVYCQAHKNTEMSLFVTLMRKELNSRTGDVRVLNTRPAFFSFSYPLQEVFS